MLHWLNLIKKISDNKQFCLKLSQMSKVHDYPVKLEFFLGLLAFDSSYLNAEACADFN